MLQALLMIAVACKRVDDFADMAEVSRRQGKDSIEKNGARACPLGYNGLKGPAWVTWV